MEDHKTHLEALRTLYQHKRIGFVSGNFKVIHPGHVRLLRYAAEIVDVLVVGVLPHNSFTEGFSEQDRLCNVQALNMVDHAFLMSASIVDDLQTLRPDFVIKGKEHEHNENIEESILSTQGGKLLFSSGTSIYSEEDALEYTKKESIFLTFPAEYNKRHGISSQSLMDIVCRIRQLRVLVVGDLIVDEYINCDPVGMSQEDPTLVVAPASTYRYVGGAGIVAAHAVGLGATTRFVTLCGQDSLADFAEQRLEEYGVIPHIFRDESRPTILKQRFRCQGKTLLRVNHLLQHAPNASLKKQMLQSLLSALAQVDVLIFSDFNYGCLPQDLVDTLLGYAHQHGVMVVADSQSSSQVGDISRFKGVHLLTPTEREARLATHDFESGLVVLADALLKKTGSPNALLTLGEAGVLIQQACGSITDQLPALNKMAADVAGAGDSLLVATTLSMAAGSDLWHAACIGSVAAAIQVSRQGNVPITLQNIQQLLSTWN